jgi:hypothetical protein
MYHAVHAGRCTRLWYLSLAVWGSAAHHTAAFTHADMCITTKDFQTMHLQ